MAETFSRINEPCTVDQSENPSWVRAAFPKHTLDPLRKICSICGRAYTGPSIVEAINQAAGLSAGNYGGAPALNNMPGLGQPVDDNPKTLYGDKKQDVSLVPPVAILAEARVFQLGAKKYGPYNWRENTVSSRVYSAAAQRHILQWQDGEDIDPESGESHLAHARACLAILIDGASLGKLNDNRPPKGAASAAIRSVEKA